MKRVVSLADARLARAVHTSSACHIVLWKSLSDFERIRKPGALLSPHDPILLGETAEAQVREMLLSCGIRAMPRTYAELFGLYTFCEQLYGLWRALRRRKELLEDDPSELFVNACGSDLYELLQHLVHGRSQEAARWHLRHRTLERHTELKVRKLEALPPMLESLCDKPNPEKL